jgi:hypothetical protein
VTEDHQNVSQAQRSTDDVEEARRRWEGIHDDECYRDVHGVPTGREKGDRRCLLYVALALAISIAVVAVAVYLLLRFVS